jgi:hypothetical protein
MNNNVTLLPSNQQIKETARAQAREVLKGSGVFMAMSLSDQQSIYHTLVNDYMDKEKEKLGISKSMATDSGAEMGYKGYNPAFGEDTRSFKELVDSVDFPKFVADLLRAVFDANLKVMKSQTDSYIKLMKECTKSTADFIKKVKDDDTFGKLVEKHQDKYNLDKEATTNADGSKSEKLILTTVDNEKADLADAEVRRHIMEAKVEMAKEHRAALREVLLMGVTRLVVEKGEIDAAVEFTIHAQRESKAHHDDQNINVANLELEYGGGLAGLFGGPSGSFSMTNTNIQVNTSDKMAKDDLTAKLTGHVNIKFKTDYFKLDNFANMYADGGVSALHPAAAPVPGAPVPAPAAGR